MERGRSGMAWNGDSADMGGDKLERIWLFPPMKRSSTARGPGYRAGTGCCAESGHRDVGCPSCSRPHAVQTRVGQR